VSVVVVLTPEAEADVAEAMQWYEERSAGSGTKFVRAVRATVDLIGNNPDMYGEVDDGLRRALVRRFPYGVFYRRQPDRADVIAVIHDWRDPTVWQCRI
jgi:plasmid stabilization system protein ParE